MSKRHAESPELTGRYICPFCSNTQSFTGYDDRGYPGDACECEAQEQGGECTCEVTLTQEFVMHDGEPHYFLHEGGGSGAEIGSYTRIRCGACRQLIYVDAEYTDDGVRRDPPCELLNGRGTVPAETDGES